MRENWHITFCKCTIQSYQTRSSNLFSASPLLSRKHRVILLPITLFSYYQPKKKLLYVDCDELFIIFTWFIIIFIPLVRVCYIEIVVKLWYKVYGLRSLALCLVRWNLGRTENIRRKMRWKIEFFSIWKWEENKRNGKRKFSVRTHKFFSPQFG